MNKSQLNAIAYAYKRKQEAENDKVLKGLGLYEVFNNQTIYTNKIFFIRAIDNGSNKAKKVIKQGLEAIMTELLTKPEKIPNNDFESVIKNCYNIGVKYNVLPLNLNILKK